MPGCVTSSSERQDDRRQTVTPKEKTASVIKEIIESREPMIITQNGEATFVVQQANKVVGLLFLCFG